MLKRTLETNRVVVVVRLGRWVEQLASGVTTMSTSAQLKPGRIMVPTPTNLVRRRRARIREGSRGGNHGRYLALIDGEAGTCGVTAGAERGMDRCLSPMGPWEIAMAGPIDRDKLRMTLRRLGDEFIFRLLYDAVELMPPAKLHKLVEPYLDPLSLLPDDNQPKNLLAKVQSFERTSFAGDYYEPFDVNSKNCMKKSTGTIAWIAECTRLLDLCVAQTRRGSASELRQCFDIIFGLLDEIDACRDNIIFFADEAGAWQVGVDWENVLPSWFKVLSATAMPEEYATRVVDLLNRHCEYESPRMLAMALKLATPAQGLALPNA